MNGGIAGTSASVLQYTAFGQTWYKGVTVSLSKRFSHNYQFLASYTLGQAEDNSTDFQSQFLPQNNGEGRNPNDKEFEDRQNLIVGSGGNRVLLRRALQRAQDG